MKYYAVKISDGRCLSKFEIEKSSRNIFPPVVDTKWSKNIEGCIKFMRKDECEKMVELLKAIFITTKFSCFEFEEEFETGENK